MIDLDAHLLETRRRTKKGGRSPGAQVSKTLQHQEGMKCTRGKHQD